MPTANEQLPAPLPIDVDKAFLEGHLKKAQLGLEQIALERSYQYQEGGVHQMPAPKLTELETDVLDNKLLRVALDIQLQRLKVCKPSRERSLAITKLQECIMWIGMDLKRLGEPNPYPNSYRPENSIVDATADGLKL